MWGGVGCWAGGVAGCRACLLSSGVFARLLSGWGPCVDLITTGSELLVLDEVLLCKHHVCRPIETDFSLSGPVLGTLSEPTNRQCELGWRRLPSSFWLPTTSQVARSLGHLVTMSQGLGVQLPSLGDRPGDESSLLPGLLICIMARCSQAIRSEAKKFSQSLEFSLKNHAHFALHSVINPCLFWSKTNMLENLSVKLSSIFLPNQQVEWKPWEKRHLFLLWLRQEGAVRRYKGTQERDGLPQPLGLLGQGVSQL